MPPACRRWPSEHAIDVHRWRTGHRCMLQVERHTPHNPLSVPFNLEHASPSRSHMPDVDRMCALSKFNHTLYVTKMYI